MDRKLGRVPRPDILRFHTCFLFSLASKICLFSGVFFFLFGLSLSFPLLFDGAPESSVLPPLAAAEGAGFVASLRRRHGRVVIFEMGRTRMPRAHADGAT